RAGQSFPLPKGSGSTAGSLSFEEGAGQRGTNFLHSFLPDGVSMAKSLGGGFPIGAFWVRGPYADLLSSGTHGTTYGGSPLACAVALKIIDVIQSEELSLNAGPVGGRLQSEVQRVSREYPGVIEKFR